MASKSTNEITFCRLTEVDPETIVAHMSDPRVREHMPLLKAGWDRAAVAGFVVAKEKCWARDGLGHWAILLGGEYVGWGGFQKEGEDWDFGLVLKPGSFGLGPRIARTALQIAISDKRIPFVTFLLPPTRQKLGGLARMGATYVGDIEHDGKMFKKFRLETG